MEKELTVYGRQLLFDDYRRIKMQASFIGRYLPAWFLWGSKEAHSVLSLELTCEAHLETLMVSKEQ